MPPMAVGATVAAAGTKPGLFMKPLQRELLERLIEASAEPVLTASTERPDWPVVLCNPAFERLHGEKPVLERPLADVVETLLGRELALEVSETIRSRQETSIPVLLNKREYLLVLRPVSIDSSGQYYALYWRSGHGSDPGAANEDIHHALLRAKRRIRDLSRDDPVTGLLNEPAFREVLEHDWAVAAREKSSLALISFTLDYFDAYLEVFGRHATDSCLRRVAQAIRRCMRRASDVAVRITTIDGDALVVLSHASDEAGVMEFAERISGAVRELGLHHPRSKAARFVTVSHQARVVQVDRSKRTPAEFLDSVIRVEENA
jgi:diguanylate cyclase (GGDEF)-like protein